MVWSRVRGSVVGFALGLTLAPSAYAVVVRSAPCNVWVDEASSAPFLDAVPIEGKVILPYVLQAGAAATDVNTLSAPVILAQVYDASGQSVPGYISSLGGGPGGTAAVGMHAEWISSRPLVAGARYRLEVDAQNSPDCQPYAHLMGTYDFAVADTLLPERMQDALPEVESVTLDWVRADVSPQCCRAADIARCDDPERCFACVKSAVKLNVVVPVLPAPQSAYLSTELLAGTSASTAPLVVKAPEPGATDVRAELGLCSADYCASWRVRSEVTDASVESAQVCVPGAPPTIEPEENGAVMVTTDPCATTAIDASPFRFAAPPTCDAYPEVRWFDEAVEGLVALGLNRSTAEARARATGMGAFGGIGGGSSTLGGTGGTTPASPAGGTTTTTHSAPSCTLTSREHSGASVSRLAWLGAALLALRHRRRRWARR